MESVCPCVLKREHFKTFLLSLKKKHEPNLKPQFLVKVITIILKGWHCCKYYAEADVSDVVQHPKRM